MVAKSTVLSWVEDLTFLRGPAGRRYRAPFEIHQQGSRQAQQPTRYQDLLKTKLNEVELQYLEKRLSEERFAIAMLNFLSPPAALKA